jgi:hypothetical protein
VTAGESTNVSRIAKAIGMRTACARYRTTTTSTNPAKTIQDFTVCVASSIGWEVVWLVEEP